MDRAVVGLQKGWEIIEPLRELTIEELESVAGSCCCGCGKRCKKQTVVTTVPGAGFVLETCP